jgi:hypothetical protein
MPYSSIVKKRCKNENCNNWPKMGYNGFCGLKCMPEEMRLLPRYAKQSVVNKANKQRKSTLSRKLHSVNQIVQNQKEGQEGAVMTSQGHSELTLDGWFLGRMEKEMPICQNCHASKSVLKLPGWEKVWKSCQAHLLPKRHFKSIITHPLNGMVLGSGFSQMCLCHDIYDSSWEKAAKMNIWPEVVRRFLIMYPLIPESEYRFIPDQLTQELNQI